MVQTAGDHWPEHIGIEGVGADALTGLRDEVLPRYLLGCRWYASKDAGRPDVDILDLMPFGGNGGKFLLAIVAARPPGRAEQRYFLPLALAWDGRSPDSAGVIAEVRSGERRGVLLDALHDDRFVTALVERIRSAGPDGSRDVSGLVFRGAPADGHGAVPAGGIERSRAEQSNTSLRIGGVAMLKALRQLQPGIHPEIEVSRFLSEATGFRNTPAFLGSVERAPDGGEPTALCIMQALVPNQGDGWSHVLERLASRLEEAAPSEPLADPALLDLARMLGRRTGELHHAFSVARDDPAFRPEPVEPQHLDQWAEAARSMARRSLDAMDRALDSLRPTLRDRAEALLARRDEAMARIDALVPDRLEVARTRLHGDYHLGQVLVSDGDVFIIDFEGEPMRPVEERREKHSPLRDVAGMLRSFRYAAAAAARDLSATGDTAGRLDDWADDMSSAFLAAYRDAARDCPSVPADEDRFMSLLRLFLLEKAFYEIGYELANRPDWVSIPLEGVLSILDQAVGAGEGPGASGVERAHAMPFGAELQADGRVRFRLWAPGEQAVTLDLESAGAAVPMEPRPDGWHELVTDRVGVGSRYRYELASGLKVPDPASRYQPDDVHGPSEVIDPRAYRWTDAGWKGRPWHETVLYEMHVGTFTEAGTFRAAIDRLDHLVELGVTAVELLPLADFPGRRNWGYDGVLFYAPDGAYGRPEDLKALVDAAHARGLMVFLDVVYNHFGPDGNYFGIYAPQLFTERHHTPWGAAVNYDGPGSDVVRDFMIHNAMYWLEEFHFDGLRFDAVHAIIDDSPKHFLEEMAERIRAHFGPDRHVHLVLENDANQARFLERDGQGAVKWYDAQWDDDLHHCLHTAASGEDAGYYAAYAGRPELWGRALAEGFSYQGEVSPFSDEARGESSAHLPPTAFVGFLQNHDQIGNRAFGDRITAFSPPEAVRAAACLYLLAPSVPMLFMGEEWAASQPFPFFCDFGPELAEAVRKGRSEEFAKFPEFQDPEARERIPDATAPGTFEMAKLDWGEREREPHAGWLAWYRRLLAVRAAEIVPRLAGAPGGAARYETLGERGLRVEWRLGDASRLSVVANLSAHALPDVDPPPGTEIWREGAEAAGAGGLGPWQVVWTVRAGDAR